MAPKFEVPEFRLALSALIGYKPSSHNGTSFFFQMGLQTALFLRLRYLLAIEAKDGILNLCVPSSFNLSIRTVTQVISNLGYSLTLPGVPLSVPQFSPNQV